MFDIALQVFGWTGSAILVISLLQPGMMRLRTMNLIASLVLTAYNAALGVWPMVGMNAAVAIIDLYYIVRLTRPGTRVRTGGEAGAQR